MLKQNKKSVEAKIADINIKKKKSSMRKKKHTIKKKSQNKNQT